MGQDGSGFGVFVRQYGAPRVAPQVVGVYVSGSRWSAALRQSLQREGLGTADLGFAMTASNQGNSIAWAGVDTFSVVFNGDVQVDAGDLSVAGANVAGYALDPAGFIYNAATKTATWRLAARSALSNDRIVLELNADAPDGVKSVAGTYLDGEWDNGGASEAFPSGNGTPGGDFRFGIAILSGDVTRDGRVDFSDLSAVRSRQGLSAARPGAAPGVVYSAMDDVTGDGVINVLDYAVLRRRIGAALPAGMAGAPGVEGAGSRIRPAVRRRTAEEVLG
jgi:hypothetical protein